MFLGYQSGSVPDLNCAINISSGGTACSPIPVDVVGLGSGVVRVSAGEVTLLRRVCQCVGALGFCGV